MVMSQYVLLMIFPMDVVTTIEEHRHELPGVTIDVEPLRYYPYGNDGFSIIWLCW